MFFYFICLCLLAFEGFMTYLVEPLFGEWARFSNTRLSQTMLGHLGLNKASWKGVQREQSGSGDDVDPTFEEMDSDILPQEPRLSWPQSPWQNCLFPRYLVGLKETHASPRFWWNGKMMPALFISKFSFDTDHLTQNFFKPPDLNIEQYAPASVGCRSEPRICKAQQWLSLGATGRKLHCAPWLWFSHDIWNTVFKSKTWHGLFHSLGI